METIDERDIDCDRMRQRAGIRADMARAQLLREQADALDAEVARLRGKIEDAVIAHGAICGPLQAELATLENQAIERIKTRQEADPAADARRAEILGEIARQNTTLKAIRDTQSKLALPLEGDAQRIRMDAAQLPNESYLARPGIGCPKLLLQYTVFKKRSELEQQLLEIANTCTKRTSGEGPVGRVNNLNSEEWASVADSITAAVTALRAECDRVYRALVDE